MIACYKGHIRIAKYLLAMKADANRKSVKGNTALHDCAESGSLEILKILVEHGARMDVDSYGMTPLLAAAVTGQNNYALTRINLSLYTYRISTEQTNSSSIGHTHMVEHLIGMKHLVGRKERIDALELLGATYVDKKRDMIGAMELWKRAMEERFVFIIPTKYFIINFYKYGYCNTYFRNDEF